MVVITFELNWKDFFFSLLVRSDVWTGEGNGNPLQYSFLGNPMDRGVLMGKESDMTEQLNNNKNKMCGLE